MKRAREHAPSSLEEEDDDVDAVILSVCDGHTSYQVTDLDKFPVAKVNLEDQWC